MNHSPSFNLDLPVDAETKEALLRDTFAIIYMGNGLNDKRRKNPGGQIATAKGNFATQGVIVLAVFVIHMKSGIWIAIQPGIGLIQSNTEF